MKGLLFIYFFQNNWFVEKFHWLCFFPFPIWSLSRRYRIDWTIATRLLGFIDTLTVNLQLFVRLEGFCCCCCGCCILLKQKKNKIMANDSNFLGDVSALKCKSRKGAMILLNVILALFKFSTITVRREHSHSMTDESI